MPELCRFLGIVILMNFNEHNPPYFHAKYNDFEIIVEINSGIVEGEFPKRALSMVFEWCEMLNGKLLQNRELIQTTGEFKRFDFAPEFLLESGRQQESKVMVKP